MLVPLTWAQVPTNNQWVLQSSGQLYWKFPVVQTGIYRIDSTTMAQAGVLSAPNFDPRRIRIYRNGNEVPLYINGEQDGIFNSGDYIEFFGQRNDATADRHFFSDTSWMVNRNYSLYTDTSYYFLTITPSFNNSRMSIDPMSHSHHTRRQKPGFGLRQRLSRLGPMLWEGLMVKISARIPDTWMGRAGSIFHSELMPISPTPGRSTSKPSVLTFRDHQQHSRCHCWQIKVYFQASGLSR
jgi:hypothetical protein